MILAPAGSFDMGSDGRADTAPRHTVGVGAFYLAKTAMTQGQWKTLMGVNPSYYQGAKFPQADQFPVEQVSWQDCQAMLAAVKQEGGRRPPAADRGGMGICGERGRERDVRSERGALVCVAAGELAVAPTVTINVPAAPMVPPVATGGTAGKGPGAAPTTPGAARRRARSRSGRRSGRAGARGSGECRGGQARGARSLCPACRGDGQAEPLGAV